MAKPITRSALLAKGKEDLRGRYPRDVENKRHGEFSRELKDLEQACNVKERFVIIFTNYSLRTAISSMRYSGILYLEKQFKSF